MDWIDLIMDWIMDWIEQQIVFICWRPFDAELPNEYGLAKLTVGMNMRAVFSKTVAGWLQPPSPSSGLHGKELNVLKH